MSQDPKVQTAIDGVQSCSLPDVKANDDDVPINKTLQIKKQDDFNKPKVTAVKKLQIMENSASGSATGNPRNKVALRPGHSLMDWVRLGNSGRDLTGVGGVPREVSPAELAKHNRTEDAWIAIKGRVYNVTQYLDFHPGGVPELMRGVGRDGTSLFNQVHAWVNYEQILQKCMVGPLKGGLLFTATQPARKNLSQLIFGKKTSSSAIQDTPPPSTGSIKESVRSPRLDWFQQLGSLTLVLYAGMIPRGPGRDPPWVRVTLDEQGVTISILVVNVGGVTGVRYEARLKLHAPVRWPPQAIRTHPDSGKVEVLLSKESESLWPRYGDPAEGHGLSTSADDTPPPESLWWSAKLTESTPLTRDTWLLAFQMSSQVSFTLPVGCHLRVRDKDGSISRSYTPVAGSVTGTVPSAGNMVTLLVKRYENGELTPKLCSLLPDTEVEMGEPLGTFDARRATCAASIYLAAAGTGITPMLRLLALALQDPRKTCIKLRLMFFNRTEEDIIWRDQLDQLAKDDSRFEVLYVLSEVSSEWSGLKGRVNCDLLATLFDLEKGSSASSLQPAPSLVCVCGPDAFTLATKSLLKEMELPEDQLHCFFG